MKLVRNNIHIQWNEISQKKIGIGWTNFGGRKKERKKKKNNNNKNNNKKRSKHNMSLKLRLGDIIRFNIIDSDNNSLEYLCRKKHLNCRAGL